MEAAYLHEAATKPLSPSPTHPSPTTPVALHVPPSLSGPVRARRRRLFRALWQPAVAHLRGSALVVDSSAGVMIAALDVHAVRRTGTDTVAIHSDHPTAKPLHLRLPGTGERWISALSAAAARKAKRLSDFQVVSPVGKGGGGAVFLVRERDGNGEALAMKVVQKHDAFHSDGSLRRALDERVVLQMVRGFPFVVQLRHAFQTDSALYMLSEFCRGGNLRTLLSKQPRGRMDEDSARRIMAQIVLALEHVHSLNVIYRDVKPENVLLSADGDVRLCDFGLAKIMSTGRFGRTKSFCGSTSYMSPQVVSSKPYGIATDLWSLGALSYRMLVGRAPFDDPPRGLATRNDPSDIQRRIQLGEVTFPTFLSKGAMEMLEGLLRKEEEERTNLQDLKESLFFEGVNWDRLLDEGYERAAKVAKEGVDETDEKDVLANFDADRLRSHGVALHDRELRRAAGGKKAEPQGGSLARIGFVSRQTSKLAALSLRKRSEMTRKPSVTSIVGFGFATDASSEMSLNVSGSDDTFGSYFDMKRTR